MLLFPAVIPDGPDAVLAEYQDFTRLQVPDIFRAHRVQGAGLGCHDVGTVFPLSVA